MIYTFESRFADRIENFIAQKNALGFGYLESSRLMRDFDRFCLARFPDVDFLTEEICIAWATKKDTEGNNTFRNRMMPVREFARYLNRNGEVAYILPPDIAQKDAPYVPYIYTETEILEIWDVFDHLKPRIGFPVRQFVIPAMVKLMYCCGLRPAEARRLRVNDVDLDIGRLNIMESKRHRSRIVMMTDDVSQMLSDCNTTVASVMPGREPFFPNSEGSFYGKRGLEKTFRQVLKKAGVTGTGRRSPRLYDFRHTFATHRLYHWMREGRDLNTMLPYLSAYMGHAQLSDTYYYIHLVPGLMEEMSGMQSDNPHSGIYEADTTRTLDSAGGNPSCNQGGMAVVGSYAIQGSMIGRSDENGPQGDGINEDVSFTLNTADRHAVYMMTTGCYAQVTKDTSPTLLSRDWKEAPVVTGADYFVRRLTPTECARLQGFPDWWCADLGVENPTEDEISFWSEVWEVHRSIVSCGKKAKTRNQIVKWLKDPHTDAAEYKLWGNGVALPCVFFVLAGIAWAAEQYDN